MPKTHRIAICVLISSFLTICMPAHADCPPADLSGNCIVDLQDMVIFADQWLNTGGPANLDNIGRVDLADFALFAKDWGVDNSTQAIVINEFMARNTASIQDEASQNEDWIELHNYGSSPINVGGMYLADNVNDPSTRWMVPTTSPTETTIPPGGYLIIWADDDAGDGLLHATFKLSWDNGTDDVALYDSTENLIDSIENFGLQGENHSYGRYPDASANWRVFDGTEGNQPTPNASNGGPVVENTVVINEIMYHPPSENDLDEFIELYNYGSQAIDVTGWRFADGIEITFPAALIPAGGYLVVAADAHTFQTTYGRPADVAGWVGVVSNKSETIELVDPSGKQVDYVQYADEGDWARRLLGPLDHGHRGWTWSDAHDGMGRSLELINHQMPNEYGQNWAASMSDNGTPGGINTVFATQSAPFVTNVTHFPIIPGPGDNVSVTASIIDESDSGLTVTLHYRVDGQPAFNTETMRDDGQSNDGAAGDRVYGGRIPPQADTLIVEFYVQAQDAGGRSRTWPAPSDVDGMAQQVTNLLYQVDDSFDAGELWTPGVDPIYYVIMIEAERAKLADIGDGSVDRYPHPIYPNDDEESDSDAQMNATFIGIDGVQTQIRYNTGVRNRGNRSRHDPPMNYHVNFRHDEPWNGVTALNINSKYTFSQVFGSAMFRWNDVAAPETIAVRLRVNGQDRARTGNEMYGLYAALEVYDSDWRENHFPDDPDGNLYRCTYDERWGGRTVANLTYKGTDPADYNENYIKQTNEEEDDWTDLFGLTFALNDSGISDEVFSTEVGKVADIREWMRYMATDTLLGNIEGGLITGSGDDYAMYRGMIDTRFLLLPHDLDTLLNKGDHGTSTSRSIFSYEDTSGLDRLMNNSDAVKVYFNELLDLSDSSFAAESFDPFIDLILGGWVPQGEIDDMKDFVVDRLNYVTNPANDIPSHDLTVSSGLAVISGYPRTTTDSFSLSGRANSVTTSSILVNGLAGAEWQLREGTWTYGSSGGGSPGASETLVTKESLWKYLDDNSDQGTAWREPTGYDDSGWDSGYAQLGYNEGDEATLIESGPSGGRYITTYFRQWFAVTDPSRFVDLQVNILRDDGAMIYINGVKVGRTNMDETVADEDVNYQTTAEDAIGGSDEDAFNPMPVPRELVPGLLVEGDNLIAVEIHQSSVNSSDVSFDMELIGYEAGSEGGEGSLNPGVNRVIVQAFDGKGGAGKEVDRETIDIWYDDGTMTDVPAVIQGDPVLAGNLNVTVRDSYLPGVPLVVRADILNDDGTVNRDVWDAMATLSVSDNAGVSLSTDQVKLYNGLGTAFVTISGSGDFTLNVELQGLGASKSIVDWSDEPVNTVSGGITDSETWSGIYHITGGDFNIPDGTILTLNPGTLVLIDGVASGTSGIDVDVAGAIESLGTADSPVTITAYTVGENWGEFHHSGAEPSTFEYTNITQAGRSPGVGHSGTGPVFRGSGSTLVFENCNITDNPGKIMHLTGGCDLTYRHSTFSRSWMGPEISGTALSFQDSWVFDMHAGDDADGIYVHNQQAGQECTVSGAVLANIDDDGLDTLGSKATIEDSIVRDCKDKGISVLNGEVWVSHCLVVGNNKAPEDPTVASIAAKVQEGKTAIVHVDRTTVVTTKTNGVVDYGIQSHNKYGVSTGTVIWYVTNSIIDATNPIDVDAPHLESDMHVDYSDAYSEVWPGTDNIDADPLFVNPASHNYRLHSNSPCIDAGDPLQTDPDGSRTDMGYYAYEEPAGNSGRYIAVWTAAEGPYRISGNVTVPENVTLKIMPGTTIFFENDASITINGRLVVEGAEYEQVRFTRMPTTSSWDGLQFDDTMEDNRISWAILEYGVTSNGMIGLDNSRLTLEHCTLDHTQRRRIRTENSSLIIRRCVFTDIFDPGQTSIPNNVSEHIWGRGIPAGGVFLIENNLFGTTKGHNDAIDFDGPFRPDPIAQIIGNVFMGCGDDLLDLETDAHIEGNIFQHVHKDVYNTDTGNSNVISAGSGHHFVVVRNVFYDVGHVTLIKEDSFMDFVNNTVVDATQPALYFDLAGETSGPGRGAYVDGCIFENCPTLFGEVLDTTELTVNRSMVNETELDLGAGNFVGDAHLADVANGDFGLLDRSPAKGAGPEDIDMGFDVPAGAIIKDQPRAISPRTTAAIQVCGPGLTHYSYRLNNGPWSPEQTIDTVLSLSGLMDGETYTVEVTGKNTAAAWQSEAKATSTTWTVDTSHQTLIINEVLAQSRGFTSDLIELYYDGAVALDLGGRRISDNPNNPGKYEIPAPTIVAPGEYLVLYADNEDGSLHTGFRLDGDGEGVYLYKPQGQGDEPIDSVEFGMQLSDMSVGRDVDGQWCLTVPTFGRANIVQPLGDARKLKINEWLADGEVLYNDDFIELHNGDDLPVELNGLYITDNTVSQKSKHQFGPLNFIEARGYAVLEADGQDGPGHVDFRLSAKHEILGLYDSELNEIDKVIYYGQTTDVSQGRSPDGAGTIEFFTTPTPGFANVDTIVINEVLAHSHAEAADWIELYNVTEAPIDVSGWFLTDDRDNLKKYEIPAGTIIYPDDPGGADDYLVIYEDNFGDPNAPGAHSAFRLSENGESVILSAANNGVLTGYQRRVEFGASATGVSFGRHQTGAGAWRFVPMETTTEDGPNDTGPKVGPIVISEIMYNSGDSDVEYIEFYNVDGSSRMLQEWDNVLNTYVPWAVADGVDYTFSLGTTIGANERFLVVKNRAAFEARYTNVPAGTKIFEWSDGSLSNDGETVEISLPGDILGGERLYISVDRVRYDNTAGWPAAPNGTGKSLTRMALSEYGDDVSNWTATDATPGW